MPFYCSLNFYPVVYSTQESLQRVPPKKLIVSPTLRLFSGLNGGGGLRGMLRLTLQKKCLCVTSIEGYHIEKKFIPLKVKLAPVY